MPSDRLLLITSATALFAELMMIRWMSSEIPVFAYFKNFPLLAAFIGLGVGALVAETKPFYWISSFWAFGVLSAVVAFAAELGLHGLSFPEPRLDTWDLVFDAATPLGLWFNNLGKIFLILGTCVWAFVGPGQAVGRLLRAGAPLRMYTFDILGSLTGVLGFSFLAYLSTPPALWLTIAAILLLVVGLRLGLSFMKLAPPVIASLIVAGLTFYKATNGNEMVRWSPYYCIEVQPVTDPATPGLLYYHLNVNQWIHQVMVDLSDDQFRRVPSTSPSWQQLAMWRVQYDFPFFFKPTPRSVLIGGAGSGNDVAGALRNGAQHVTAVEIDPGILYFGRNVHPARAYASDKVHVENNDIRNFLRRSTEKFDLIIFSILDSHTALSSLSSLRLDNYVYTVEGIHDAFTHLTPDGIMCLSFYESNRVWLGQRMYSSIVQATGGQRPVATRVGQAAMFIFGPGLTRDQVRDKLLHFKAKILGQSVSVPFTDTEALHGTLTVRPDTDDWPFLYSNPEGQPKVYLLSVFLILVGGALFVRWGLRGGPVRTTFALDLPMFFLGAGFLLIETKALAELSLLFGSTWIVNTFVFAAIFIMVLISTNAVQRGAGKYVGLSFIFLILTLLGWYFFPRASLNALAYWPRAMLGSFLVVLPLFFAGIVFSSLFERRTDSNMAFGSNLMGAVLGGASEALSLLWGIRSLSLLAVGFYALAWAANRWWFTAETTKPV